MGIFNQQPNNNQSKGKPIQGIQGPPGIGFNLTSDWNYDITNKKLTNMAEGTTSSDAITKNQLDTAVGKKHGTDQNIDLKKTYNVIKSKQQTFNEMNNNRDTLVCYEDIRDAQTKSMFTLSSARVVD